VTSLAAAIDALWRRLDAAAEALGAGCRWPRDMLLERDRPLAPVGERTSPNGYCHLLPAADGWFALNLAREDDRAAVPAWLEAKLADTRLPALQALTHDRTIDSLRDRAMLLDIPLGVIAEAQPNLPRRIERYPDARERPVSGLKVLDLSSLWAGPLCGALLAHCGADVLRVEDPRRPDPTARAAPKHWGRIQECKRHLDRPVNIDAIAPLLGVSDVMITSARPAALARLGLTPSIVRNCYPQLLWVAITAHGWELPGGMRVGFGDDAAAAGGVVAWDDGKPVFLGDALADPLTGLAAAAVALEELGRGSRGLLDCAMAPIAAWAARGADDEQ
jgi:hypothetical protein